MSVLIATAVAASAQDGVQSWNGAQQVKTLSTDTTQDQSPTPAASKGNSSGSSAGQQAHPKSFLKRPHPVITNLNYGMAPPGAVLTISGQNFSPTPSHNKVYFGRVKAQVVASTPTSLQVVIPDWAYGPSQLNIPLYVITDGSRSLDWVTFDIGPKYLLPSQL
jgi:hypothetical protein